MIFKKAKGIFLYDSHGSKYYDLSRNLNVIGYSDKRHTNFVKDHISSKWNSCGNTIYHERFRKLIRTIFSDEYVLFSASSLTDFFYRFFMMLDEKNISCEKVGDRFNNWISENICFSGDKESKEKAFIYDMTEFYLNNIDLDLGKSKDLKILNYFWCPETNIKTYNADIIILPELYSGNFQYINILCRKESKLFDQVHYFAGTLENLQSLYIASSLKFYFLVKEKEDLHSPSVLGWKKFIQKKRLIAFNETDKKKIIMLSEKFYENKIILNSQAPYYSYLPVTLEEYQIKFLKGIDI